MNLNATLNKCKESFSLYLHHIDEKYRDKIHIFFDVWKKFDLFMIERSKRKRDKIQMVTDYEIYRANRIYNTIERVQKERKEKIKIRRNSS